MNEPSCPEEHELLALIAGLPANSAIDSHVQRCSACQKRIRRLEKEISSLRWAIHPRDQSTQETTQAAASSFPSQAIGNRDTSVAECPRPVAIPAMIGRYRVIRLLASGGQADVYEVEHPNLASELVAKLSRRPVDPAKVNQDAVVAEGQRLSKLRHPHIARVVDLDFHEDRPFLVLEFVPGRNLRQHVGGRQMAPSEAAELIAKVARVLAVAHAVGIIHHDLKPENILIDKAGQPHLIDFGISLLRDAWCEDTGQPGVISGSIPYMAPEQARGDKALIDIQSDIFSLGAVLYELLTGNAPFGGKDLDEILARARRCEFDRDALSRSAVPRALIATCLKAMAADPHLRHAHAEELAAELERSARPKYTALILSIAVALVVVVALAVNFRPAEARRLAPFQDLIEVARSKNEVLQSVRLVQSPATGAQLRIRCFVPPGLQASFFWFGSDGKLVLLDAADVDQSATPAGVEYVYPRGQSVLLGGPAGTEFVLICAAPGTAPDLATVAAAFQELHFLQPWPALPRDSLVFVNQDHVQAEAVHPENIPRPSAGKEENVAADIEHRLDRLRQQLSKRYPFLAGVAMPHVD